MKYRATKTVIRHLNGKKSTVIKMGETYNQDVVDTLPPWYLEDGYLTPLE